MATNPDTLLHVFSTFMGMPPDTNDAPICGAILTSAYSGRNQPHCPACDRILAQHNALKVLTLTPHILAYLEKNDPKALAQARAALTL